MNKEPETYEELIRYKNCVELSSCYELTKTELNKIRSKQGTYIDSNGKESKNSYYTYEYVWTQLDPLKLDFANKNNLNYIRIYFENDIYKYY